MSQTWSQIVDYSLCEKCGACIEICEHDVYDKAKTTPFAVNAENCVDGCRACSMVCPVQAIEYPEGSSDHKCSGCGCCS